MRARENRQNAEDQRSIVGSIGYIAGNMGYMEGNLSAMDYSYGGATTHYPLWKPPSGYFPRGEAPPPYEEAVAISQAEALSAQCTVNLPSHVQRQAVASVSQQQQQVQQQQQQQQQQQLQHQHLQQHTLQLHTQPQQHPHPHAYTQQLMPVATTHTHPHAHQLNAAAAAAAAQSNQYTQSTTNLINININSGGVTTIATGENHQPPYSLQSEQQQLLHQQQQHVLEQQHQQQQQQQQLQLQQLPAATQSNSICVQTMPTPKPAVSSECSYKNCHLNISASVTTAAAAAGSVSNTLAYATGRRTPRGSQELLQQHPQQQQHQQQYLTVADVEINASASAASYHSLPASAEMMATPTHHMTQQQQQHQQYQQQQLLAAALSSPAIDMLPQMEIATITTAPSNTTDSVTQTLPMPLHATLKSQQQQQQHQQQQSQHGSKTPSSSRRYHRTIPRYFAIADPLQVVSAKPKSSSSSSTSSSDANNKANNKKPMCQCPIQHVPMSYMGSNANANANAFLSGAGKLFASSGSNPCALSPSASTRHAATLAYGQRVKSSTNSQQQQQLGQELLIAARNPCAHEPKIATISKQVGDDLQPHPSHAAVNVAAVTPPPPLQHHEDVSAPPIVLGRVQKRSSSSSTSSAAERARSSSGGGGRTASSSAAAAQGGVDVLSSAYLNRKVDAYLSLTQKQQQHFYNQQEHKQQQQQQQQKSHSDQSNPQLPPKLYKSLTNLKTATTTATTATSSISCGSSSSSSSNNNNSVATIYTLSKSTNTSMHQRKEQTPTLTLLPASPSASSSEKSSGKINSSTFYPLANNHVTYTLPKHISGKISLNSTINSVVSKVPSVISIPPLENNNEKAAAISKSTTLPKILRNKRDTAAAAAAAAASSSASNTNSSLAIAHCKMPSYPQLTAKVQSARGGTPSKQLPVCTTSKNCLNPNEHFLPNDTSLDDDYLSECENCKIAQSAKYYLDAELNGGGASSLTPQETMTLQRKSLEETKEEPHESYYRSSHTLPSNAKKHGVSKNNNREAWQFSTIPAASSSEEDINE